jgi:hypothetical protein
MCDVVLELMIECEPRDIRYIATEFDGWNERHWTLPFEGIFIFIPTPCMPRCNCVLFFFVLVSVVDLNASYSYTT